MCLHGMADSLYTRLRAAWDAHTATSLAALAARAAPDAPAFLPQFDALWTDTASASRTLRQVFAPLDAATAAAAAGAPRAGSGAARRVALHDLGLALLASHLASHPALAERAVAGLLDAVATERAGGVTDRGLAASAARGLAALGLYATSFEPALLTAADAFYAAEGDRLIADLSPADYLAHAERRLADEASRCAALLDAGTRRPLVAVLEARLLAAHVPALLERGLGPLFDAARAADLARLHAACARVGALDALRAAFKGHVRDRGAALAEAACGPPAGDERGAVAAAAPASPTADASARDRAAKELVPALLALKAAADAVVDGAFSRGAPFAAAVKEAFEAVLNRHGARPAELLAKHVDAELRGGAPAAAAAAPGTSAPPTSARAAPDELDARLDAALALFRFVQGKDVFEAFYKRDLAKRLLLARTASVDAERGVLAKLKVECGPAFTQKLEGMFKDVDASRDVLAAFRGDAVAAASLAPGLDVAVSVLTAGYWPTYDAVPLRLPSPLAEAAVAFEAHYLARHGGRRLAWRHGLSTAILRARFDRGPKELAVSLSQAVVLLLFNERETATVADVAAASGLAPADARRALASLACGRAKVLTKDPAGRDVGDDDSFSVNAGFTAPLFRVRINALQLKETPADAARTTAAVTQDRAHAVDAAIVRIMKTRKSLAHRLLAAELVAQLRFPVRAPDLKKRIESLIDREYLARDPADPALYNYLA